MTLPPALDETLRAVGEALAGANDDWWIIGSAAVALHGGQPLTVADVDLLTTPDQARRLAEQWSVALVPTKLHPLFRSEIYFQQTALPVAVDVMAGFCVNGPGDGARCVRAAASRWATRTPRSSCRRGRS